MPELPEVETVRRGLLPVMEGAVIEKAEIRRPDLRWPLPKDMGARLTGARVLGLRRRAKYILADLDRGETLLIHLGMSGRMQISTDAPQADSPVFYHPRSTPEKHDHILLDMEGGARIAFNDARRFGMMDLMPTEDEDAHPLLAKLGPEPLGNQFDQPYLSQALSGRRSAIKTMLLDQRIVAGLGNIYVCEALFRSGVSPTRQAGKLSKPKTQRLVENIRDVLSEAIEAGGSSLRDHRQADGELGYFQHSFQVYGREGAPCVTPDCTDHVARIVQGGRSSFYCPTCQR